ncbi:MAG: PspC domain-containing protein [Chloroflexia bacterium]
MALGSEPKRLTRSRHDRVIAGVCGGLARYLNVDPTLLRLICVILIFVSGGTLLLAYVVMWLIVPEEGNLAGQPSAEPDAGASVEHSRTRDLSILGLVLIAAGAYFLLRNLGLWSVARYFWPVLLIGAGVALLLPYLRREK